MTTPIERIGDRHHDVQTATKSSPLIAFVVALALVLVVAFATFVAGSDAAADGTGTVTVDDAVYSFEAETCTVSDGDFVAAGPGSLDGAPFWVSASSSDITVAFGVESELQQPDSSRLWLSSDGPIQWEHDGSVVNATTVLFDVRQPTRALPATLTASCGPTSS